MTLRVTVGETMKWSGTWRTSDGVAVDLTGYSLVAEVRSMPSRTLVVSPAIVLGNQVSAPGTYTVDVTGLDEGAYELRIGITEPDADFFRSSAIPLLVVPP